MVAAHGLVGHNINFRRVDLTWVYSMSFYKRPNLPELIRLDKEIDAAIGAAPRQRAGAVLVLLPFVAGVDGGVEVLLAVVERHGGGLGRRAAGRAAAGAGRRPLEDQVHLGAPQDVGRRPARVQGVDPVLPAEVVDGLVTVVVAGGSAGLVFVVVGSGFFVVAGDGLVLSFWLLVVLVLKEVEELFTLVVVGEELVPLDDDDGGAVFEGGLESVALVADDDVFELDSVLEELDLVVVELNTVLVADADMVPSRGQESARFWPPDAVYSSPRVRLREIGCPLVGIVLHQDLAPCRFVGQLIDLRHAGRPDVAPFDDGNALERRAGPEKSVQQLVHPRVLKHRPSVAVGVANPVRVFAGGRDEDLRLGGFVQGTC
ncbi:hypothetical protein PG985_010234 [Apiospora marii]|uniref:uncharacterized protein n=1 Tax=Apiospora marii TaxID=335849 RepID=UPI00312F9272